MNTRQYVEAIARRADDTSTFWREQYNKSVEQVVRLTARVELLENKPLPPSSQPTRKAVHKPECDLVVDACLRCLNIHQQREVRMSAVKTLRNWVTKLDLSATQKVCNALLALFNQIASLHTERLEIVQCCIAWIAAGVDNKVSEYVTETATTMAQASDIMRYEAAIMIVDHIVRATRYEAVRIAHSYSQNATTIYACELLMQLFKACDDTVTERYEPLRTKLEALVCEMHNLPLHFRLRSALAALKGRMFSSQLSTKPLFY